MNKKRIPIEELITRFTEGYTTDKEEKELYRFFNSDKVPPHLEKYIPAFRYFREGLLKEFSEPVAKHTEPAKKVRLKPFFLWSLSVAAIILVAFMLFRHDSRSTLPDPYEGSYLVRNQVKIYDMEQILAETEKIDALFAEQGKEFCQMLRKEKEIESLFGEVK